MVLVFLHITNNIGDRMGFIFCSLIGSELPLKEKENLATTGVLTSLIKNKAFKNDSRSDGVGSVGEFALTHFFQRLAHCCGMIACGVETSLLAFSWSEHKRLRAV